MYRVMYHAPCPDGATAALITALYFERSGIDPHDASLVSWHPMKVFLAPEEQFDISVVCPSDEVFFLDYAANPRFVVEVAKKAKEVVVLDHHLTALTDFGGANTASHNNLHAEFDVHRSGASIALDYFSNRFCKEAVEKNQAPQISSSLPEPRVISGGESNRVPPPPCAISGAPVRSSKKKRKRGGKSAIALLTEQTKETEVSDLLLAASSSLSVASIEPEQASEEKTKMGIIASAATSGYSALLGDGVEGLRVLRLVRLIEDGDLYRWWLRDSREFHAGFGNLRLDYDARKNPAIFARLRALDIDELITVGKSSLQGENKKIEEGLRHAFVVAVPQVSIRCLCIWTDSPELRSALGHALAERSREQGLAGLGMIVYSTPELQRKGQVKVSIRGVHDADTLVVTEKFGGGGHRAASSCNVAKFVFDSWREDDEGDDE